MSTLTRRSLVQSDPKESFHSARRYKTIVKVTDQFPQKLKAHHYPDFDPKIKLGELSALTCLMATDSARTVKGVPLELITSRMASTNPTTNFSFLTPSVCSVCDSQIQSKKMSITYRLLHFCVS